MAHQSRNVAILINLPDVGPISNEHFAIHANSNSWKWLNLEQRPYMSFHEPKLFIAAFDVSFAF